MRPIVTLVLLAVLQVILANGAVFDKAGQNATSKARSYFKSGFTRTNPHSVEVMLLYREQELFQQTVASAVSKGYSIQGFYHTSTWQPKWADVILEQLKLLDGQRRMPKDVSDEKTTYSWHPDSFASLLGASSGLHLNVAGPTKDDAVKVQDLVNKATLKHKAKITVNFNQTVSRDAFNGANEEQKKRLLADPQLTAGEHSTVDILHNYCIDKTARGEKALVYYMHSESRVCVSRIYFLVVTIIVVFACTCASLEVNFSSAVSDNYTCNLPFLVFHLQARAGAATRSSARRRRCRAPAGGRR